MPKKKKNRKKNISNWFSFCFFRVLYNNNSSKTGARHHSLAIRGKLANILKYLVGEREKGKWEGKAMPSLLGMLRQLIKLYRYPCIYV